MKSLIIMSVVFYGSVLMAGIGMNMPTYSDFDTNQDGQITQKEFESSQEKRMTKQAEAGKMLRNAPNAPSFKDVDVNGDGVINAAEFKSHQSQQRPTIGKGMK